MPVLSIFGDASFNWCNSKNPKSKSRGQNNCNAISLSSKNTHGNWITPKHQKMALFDSYMCRGLNFMQQLSNKMRIYCKISAIHKNERRLRLSCRFYECVLLLLISLLTYVSCLCSQTHRHMLPFRKPPRLRLLLPLLRKYHKWLIIKKRVKHKEMCYCHWRRDSIYQDDN